MFNGLLVTCHAAENYELRGVKQDLLCGRKIVIESLERGDNIEKVFVLSTLRGEDEIKIRKLCTDRLVPLKVVPSEKLNQLTRANHQGVVALTSAVQYYDLEDIIPHIYEQGQNPLILLLDRITDIRNLGAIARSAEIFGAHAIVYTMKKSAEVNAHSIKVSAGALLQIPICRVKNIQDAMAHLKQSGLKIFGSSLDTDHKIADVDFTEPCAIVVGSEDLGISREVAASADALFKIPQVGNTESLNASVATGVCLYEIMNQRNK